jgi:hypothetical protein
LTPGHFQHGGVEDELERGPRRPFLSPLPLDGKAVKPYLKIFRFELVFAGIDFWPSPGTPAQISDNEG